MRRPEGLRRARRAFTLVEVALAIVLVGIMAAIALPRYADELRRTREVNATHAIAADLELAGSLAATQRRPVRLRWIPARSTYEIALRDSAVVLVSRSLGSASEWQLEHVTFSPPQVDFFPGGILSSPLRITYAVGSRYGQVTVSRAGLVRESP